MARIHIAIFSLLAIVGCTAHNPAAPSDLVSVEALVRMLNHVGARASVAEQMPRDAFPFFSVNAHRVLVDGETVHVFLYADPAGASADAARIDPSGQPIGTQVTWVNPPRFYARGQLIVLYVGRNRGVSSMLETVLGAPFAGAR